MSKFIFLFCIELTGVLFVCAGSYHQYECGREDVYESTMGRIIQQGKTQAEGVQKVHRLALKVAFRESVSP
jgi:hypothetical protein